MKTPDKDKPQIYDATKREYDAIAKIREHGVVSPEYREGERLLEYSYTFPNGTAFVVKEEEPGTIKIVLEKEGKTLFDFASLLGSGYTWTTPSMSSGSVSNREKRGVFLVSRPTKEVSLGEFKHPSALLMLLHEIGHTHQDEVSRKWEKQQQDVLVENIQRKTNVLETILSAKGVRSQAQSFLERDAWAYALRMARKLKREFDVDLLGDPHIFRSKEELEDLIYGALLTYRIDHERGAKKYGEETVLGKAYVEKELKKHLVKLLTLFDKERLKK
ncbi:MAG: hypothetical protein HZA35_01520 [Parcubacteria group bacterium]|nr:hypothetical protein [Parcubacteria group bacterium]